jgi:amino acid adenylation domain-containing protein
MIDFDIEQSATARFDAVAAASPDELAVDAPAGDWTYAVLSRESRRIAHALAGFVGETVAVLARHDAPALAAALGVLRAGAIWVPLDPRHPAGRHAEILSDSGARVLVCDFDHRAAAFRLVGERAICLADLGDADDDAPLRVGPGDPAYLLYTSGSTGRPKGVVQSHRNLLHHARAYARSLDLQPRDRVALLAGFAVDAAMMDVFGSLLSGGSLHLWDVASRGTDGLADWLDARGIGVYHSTPTVFRFWAEELGGRRLAGVRRVVLGGEPADRGDFDLFRRSFDRDAVLVNGLGPTECTLALQAFFPTDADPPAGTLAVGGPVDGMAVVLLDEREVDGAREGELGIASPHVALGYWHRPDLTDAAFLPGPSGTDVRIFRTGDVVRRLPDGSLLPIGRRDRRIKLGGIGIQPEEIEAELRALPGVAEAAVVLREWPPSAAAPAALVAFATSRGGVRLDPDALMAGLRARLPAVMVPARLEVVDHMPRTGGGKVDRRALAVSTIARASTPLVGPTQAWLALAFEAILGLVGVGSDGHFFELGGHSLLAMRLLARVRAELSVDLSLGDLFEAPTVAGLAARIHAASRGSVRPPLERSTRDGRLPLSPAQERLFFFDRLAPGSPTYHVPAVSRLRGPIDASALGAALADVVARHEALRATFALEDGVPVQRVEARVGVEVELVSIDAADVGDRWAQALARAGARAMQPFDLARGPLLRAALFRLGPDDHVLSLVVHHVAVDGWSMHTLFADWSLAYAARLGGSAPAPRESVVGYADFAVWQRGLLGGPIAAELRGWWRDALAGVEGLEIAGDRPRPAAQSHRGEWCRFELPARLVDSLRSLARECGATLYMTSLCAFGALLSRHTGQDDVVIASPIADRAHPDLQGVLGNFVNTVPLRLDFSGDPTVGEMLGRARRVAVAAVARSELPFDQIVAEARVERDAGREPLAQAMLIFHHGAPAHLEAPGLVAEPIELHLGVAMADIALTLRESDGVEGWFEYATDLFDESTALRLRDRWLALLESMAAGGSGARLADLELLPASERRAVLVDFNRTDRPYDLSTTIRERIEDQASLGPDRTAAAFADDSIRYGELLGWSRRIALALRERGVTPGSLVPIVAERGLDLVAGLLGILEAGAAFVPVDPGWPAARLGAALARIAPAAVVVDAAHAAAPAIGGLGLVCTGIARGGATPASPVAPPLAPTAGPDDPVYGYFTSGSTGEPKLALVRQAGLANRFAWMDEFFGREPPVTLQTTPHFFDSAVWQILWPLCRGGTAVLPSSAPLLGAEEIASLIDRHSITIVDFVPSVLDALLPRFAADPDLSDRLRSLRDAIAGGEALRPETLRGLRAALPGVRLINLYGPTETTIGCVAAVLDGSETTIPIGRPIANVRAVVLDRAGRLAPIGVPGELYLSGACLGLGYFGQPEATRRAFVDNRFPELGHPTLYRTGDRVRQRADGTLDFLGRCDDQIKLRGLRIEPGDVEAALRSHPAVAEAFVAPGRGATGEAELWAWIAPSPAPADLRDHLRERLPRGWVPSVVVACDALPRGPGGKVERRALPRPSEPRAPRDREPPRTGIEEIVARIWGGLVRLDVVDRHANFFDLGGHSLLALRAQAELEGALGRDVALIDLFRYPTVAGLARHLAGQPSPPIEPGRPREMRAAAARRRRDRGD